ncbi:SGNH/GDSL hydrolase family protein [Microbacterium sp. NPDC058345]|uniref:SGNH/GDSL hydrolase family protein n=1 Tax=Microbacterium sp. NPDC058345 TaxID=3346455 RepID=UPI00364A6928
MTLRVRTRRRRTALVIVGAFAVVLGVSLGITRPWQPPVETAPVAAAEDGIAAPAPLALPEHPTVLVFGDSWTYGSAASVPTLGYAYVLADLIDGETVVDGVPGSGYLKPGSTGPAFGARIAALDPAIDPDAIIIQGSINDRREDAAALPAAVNAAWDALTQKFPEVPIVVLGPAPHELPVDASTARIDRELAALAGSRGWWYVSPVKEQWITPDNYLSVIDVGVGRKHPSTAGHRYLAERVAEALERLGAAPVTAADGEQLEPAK